MVTLLRFQVGIDELGIARLVELDHVLVNALFGHVDVLLADDQIVGQHVDIGVDDFLFGVVVFRNRRFPRTL
jgi:hypothetical protein